MDLFSLKRSNFAENNLKWSDEPCFESEVLPHLGSVRAFALSLTRETSAAEDLLQDTMLRAFRGFASFRPGTDCRSWLFRICRNRFYDLCRSRARRPVHEDVDCAQPVALDRSWEVQKELERLEKGDKPDLDLIGDRVRCAIDQLSDEYRQPLLMCDLDGLSYQEIAEALSVPIGTVRSRISRARSRLRDELQEYARGLGFPVTASPAA